MLTLATGSGKTIIATNLLWRLAQAGQLPKPALFLCDRDELREQAYTKLKAAFGDNARIVEDRSRAATPPQNARIHIATYQTLGLDDEDDGFASFLSEHYGEDAFSVIIIDECHRSAWGKWSEVLRRNPNAIHIGLTATPRKLRESKHATAEDQEITANNRQVFRRAGLRIHPDPGAGRRLSGRLRDRQAQGQHRQRASSPRRKSSRQA